MFLGVVSRGELFLSINVTVLVQFGKNLSQILPPLSNQNYLLQSISVRLIYQFLHLIYGYLFFRCFGKFLEEERNENKEGNSRGVTIRQLPLKEDRKDRDDEILVFDFAFVGQYNTDFNFIFCYYWLFYKSQFSGI